MERQSKSSATRERIIEATVALLLEAGMSGTQTRAVTERAGVGTGLLNHYFRWPELRATAWAAIFDGVARDVRRDGEPPDRALDRFFSETFSDDARPIWRLWIEAENFASADPGLADALAVARAALRRALTDLLAAGRTSGEWELRDPEETALRLEALRDGLAGMILSGDSAMEASKAERHLRKLFDLERIARLTSPTGAPSTSAG